MEKFEGDGPDPGKRNASAKVEAAGQQPLRRSFSIGGPVGSVDGVVVLPLSKMLRLLLPPLLVSSLPRRAIGFSFPRGAEGKFLGVSLLVAMTALSFLMDKAFGVYAVAGIVWLMGGTAAVILYNSTSRGVAFVKEMCSTCRLRPIIEEHEMLHLGGVASEEEVWNEARKRYSYAGLGLATDPKIHNFCPIAQRLKESP